MTITLNGTTGISNDGGYTGDGVSFADTTPANTLVTTTGGNVGIGTSSPVGKLHINTSTGYNAVFETSGTQVRINYLNAAASANVSAAYRATDFAWQKSDGAEAARIDSSGNVIMTSNGALPSTTVSGVALRNANNVGPSISSTGSTATGGQQHWSFINGNGQQGFIATGTTGTTYSTSSDYRLKENIAPMTGALAKVSALKPCTYTWKSTGEQGEGFIAHELQEVVPDAVAGEKDAVDADGNPVYQGIDTSFLVATLTAAIQELKAELDTVKAEVTALKGTA